MKKNPTLDFYKLFWIFILGSIFGWAIELIWFLVKWRFFQYNQGLLYGPFQPIYGFGAVILTLLCYFFKTNKKWLIFLIGFIAFGLYEHISGFLMEYVLGAFAWDYTRVGFNLTIGKYIYLPYCFIWGLFAVIWDLWVNDKLLNFFDKYKKEWLKYFTIILAIFMTVNFTLTQLAIARKMERAKNIPPHNECKIFLDKYYDDKYFSKYMPKVRVPEK